MKKNGNNECEKIDSHYPDFSSVFKYDEELELYEVSLEQLNYMIEAFEKRNPSFEVKTEETHIYHKSNVNNDVVLTYNEIADDSNGYSKFTETNNKKPWDFNDNVIKKR